MSSEPIPTRPGIRASLQFLCPGCEEMFLYPIDKATKAPAELDCPSCQIKFRGGGTPPVYGQPVEKCWLCGNNEFYVQKDFNRELGFMIVLASAMIIFLMLLLFDPIFGMLCLLAIALIDLAIYRMLSEVTVCYLCQTIYRGFPQNPEHRAFYLGNEERFKKIRQEWAGQAAGKGKTNEARRR